MTDRVSGFGLATARWLADHGARHLVLVSRSGQGDKETEAAITSTAYALTRFANNQIHQNVAEESTLLSIRVVKDRATARVNTNKLDEDSIRQACENVQALASLQPPDPDRLLT